MWIWFVLYIWLVIVSWELAKYIFGRIRIPHRWSCPYCELSVGCTKKEGVDSIKADHLISFHADQLKGT